MIDTRIAELFQIREEMLAELGRGLPYSANTIIELEDAGYTVDLVTGEVSKESRLVEVVKVEVI